MSDLTEFLKARLDEDERAAEIAAGPVGHDWHWDEGVPRGRRAVIYGRDGVPDGELRVNLEDRQCGDHIARHDPTRVLAEMEAKRCIVDEHTPDLTLHEEVPQVCPVCCSDRAALEEHPCPTLRLLALSYASHPDYRNEWMP